MLGNLFGWDAEELRKLARALESKGINNFNDFKKAFDMDTVKIKLILQALYNEIDVILKNKD